jgi:TolB-like protein/DNA-binding winged helix-turn-helix (wHTH) protein/Tfp pilus assembly protein PilF
LGEVVHPDFAATRRVTLAREASFTVGRLTVHPATRQALYQELRQTLEPRVMQVLVALARAGGEVVSKEELIDFCWQGRVVGEDAINRAVSRLRHLASTIGGDSFRINTIRGVGYRLLDTQSPAKGAEVAARPTGNGRSRISRWTMMAGLAVAGVAIVAGVGLQLNEDSGVEAEPVSVAVLPFKNMSAGTPYFAEGVAEGVANQLAREPQFKVAGRTSSSLFKDAADFRDVGRRLHVAYVLEGSVQSAGEQVRVDVSLVDARKGMRLWSQNFRGSLNDLFAIQDAISQQVAVNVRRQLIKPALPRGTTITRGDLYSLYLTARGLIGTREPAKLHSATELLRQAVRLDPNYAPAWAQLAMAMRFEWQRSGPNPMELDSARREWLRIARHALQLAPDSADSHLGLCYVLSSFAGETTQYEELEKRHCERAAQLDPNRGEVWDSIGQSREYEGDFPGALEAYRRLFAIEPLWWHGYGSLTVVSWRMGYRNEARKVVAQTVRDAKPFSGNMALALLATEQGDWSEALKRLRAARAVAEPGEKGMADARIALVMRSLGFFEQARNQFPYYEVDDDLWHMWNGKAPEPRRVAELSSDPAKLWRTTKMYFLARTMLRARRSSELVRLYDRRFRSPDELHAALNEASAEMIMALRNVERHIEAGRMAALGEGDARKAWSHGRVPFEFHYHRSLILAAEGRREEAIAALEKAVKLGWFYNNETYSFRDIAQEPVFRDIAPDPRFQRIRTYFAAHLARERREAEAFGLGAR